MADAWTHTPDHNKIMPILEHEAYEHTEITPVHVGSFFSITMPALRIKQLEEDVSAEPLDCIQIYLLKLTVTFPGWGKSFLVPILLSI